MSDSSEVINTSVYVVGSDVEKHGVLGVDWLNEIMVPITISELSDQSIVQIASSCFYALALNIYFKIWSWGLNDYGALGRSGVRGTHPDPVQIEHIDINYIMFRKVACGKSISTAISDTGKLYTWGTFNTSRGVYDYSPTCRMQLFPRIVDTLAKFNIVDIAAGASHCLALDDQGRVFSWSCGEHFQLGRSISNDDKNDLIPSQIPELKDIVFNACGAYHSVALNNSGHGYTCGLNHYQQCGLVKRISEKAVSIPKNVIPSPSIIPYFSDSMKNNTQPARVKSVAAGEYYSIMLMDNNRLLIFGHCDEGQLGMELEKNQQYLGAMRESNVTDGGIVAIGYPVVNRWDCEQKLVKVICGSSHTLVLTEDGSEYGFGQLDQSALCPNGKKDTHLPTLIDTEFVPQRAIDACAGNTMSMTNV